VLGLKECRQRKDLQDLRQSATEASRSTKALGAGNWTSVNIRATDLLPFLKRNYVEKQDKRRNKKK